MTELRDLELEGVSNCCSAKVYEGGWCADCKDHCEAVSEETDERPGFEGNVITLVKNIFCARCDSKKKVPTSTTEAVCECGAKMS